MLNPTNFLSLFTRTFGEIIHLTAFADNDIMKRLHKGETKENKIIESRKEHPIPLCSNIVDGGCSFLEYKYTPALSEVNLNKAYDILFNELWRRLQSK